MWLYDYTSENDNPYGQDPFLPITHMSYVDNLPQWRYPYHVHQDSFELIFITQATGTFDVDTHTVDVSPGSIIVVAPGVFHRLSSEDPEGMRYYTICFSVPEGDHSLCKYFQELGTAVTNAGNYLTHIQTTLRLLVDLTEVNNGKAEETFQSISLGLLQLCRSLFTNQSLLVRLDENRYASDILHYIMTRNGKDITLESLAKHFNVSQSHLSRIFCNAYHVSPINYAIHARITVATEYLLKTDRPITEIASACGYDNPAHFTNMFIKRIGCSPTEYRERNGKRLHQSE